jgi:hypothetical protein
LRLDSELGCLKSGYGFALPGNSSYECHHKKNLDFFNQGMPLTMPLQIAALFETRFFILASAMSFLTTHPCQHSQRRPTAA